MLYRIYTERKDDTISYLTAMVASRFDSFTITNQTGYWEGKAEPSVCFEIDIDSDVGIIRNLAQDIKNVNQQECVMVQAIISQRYLE